MKTKIYLSVIALCLLSINVFCQDLAGNQKFENDYKLFIEKQKTPLLDANGESFFLDGTIWQRSYGDCDFFLAPTLNGQEAVSNYTKRITSENDKEKGICKSTYRLVKIDLTPKSISMLAEFNIYVPDYIHSTVKVYLPQIDIDKLLIEGIETEEIKSTINSSPLEIETNKTFVGKDLIWSEGFEGAFPGTEYSVGDSNSSSGYDYWNDVSCEHIEGLWSIWCAGTGDMTDCYYYDYNMESYVRKLNGIPLSNYTNVWFNFKTAYITESNYDYMKLWISGDYTNWTSVATFTGGYATWHAVPYMLTGGWTSFWWEFDFHSDNSNNYAGAYIDDMTMTGDYVGYPPVAAFTGSPLEGNAPLTVQFTDQSTNAPTTWQWSFGDGATSTSYEQNPIHTYSSGLYFTVTLTVYNEYGSDTETKVAYIDTYSTQYPPAITIQPFNATVYDEVTLTFNPWFACFESGSLLGLPSIAMESGVTVNGVIWSYIVGFNQTGNNGQSPTLVSNPDGTYSITYVPYEFYGFPSGENVTQICAVFNNGMDWTQDGRDFDAGGTGCIDFFIPIGSNLLPSAVTMEPADASVYDEVTLTFDPDMACFVSGSLANLPSIGIYSGVAIDGNMWQNIIPHDGTGINGQSPTLISNPNGTYSITYVPYEFYGFAYGTNVSHICAVFNNGNDWTQDGRDFEMGSGTCIDFFIPIRSVITGLYEKRAEFFTINPNPVSAILKINSQSELKSYSVYSLLGKNIINSTKIVGKSFEVDVKDLSIGIYFIQVEDQTGKMNACKFIKK